MDEYNLYLLQRFNDYEVPLSMSAEKVRELLGKFYKEFESELSKEEKKCTCYKTLSSGAHKPSCVSSIGYENKI